MKQILILLFFISFLQDTKAQPCVQPGSLVTVFNTTNSHAEYLVFKFLLPYSSKGTLTPYNGDLFTKKTEKRKYYKINFLGVNNFCDNKLNRLKLHHKITGFKTEQKGGGSITYVFEVTENTTVTSHISYVYHGAFFVKIKLQ
jgi:hypothetical protein